MKSSDLIQEAYDEYKRNAGKIDYKISKPEEELIRIEEDELEYCGVPDNLRIYTHWMSYYAAKIHQWKFMVDYLERSYKHRKAKGLGNRIPGIKKYQQEGQLEDELNPIMKAFITSESRLSAAKTNYNFAENQRDLVSRVITFQTSALKTIGRE